MLKLFIKNIPSRLTSEEVEAYFIEITPGATFKLVHSPSTAESMGFGTLEVKSSQLPVLTESTRYIGGSEIEIRTMPKWQSIPGSQVQKQGEENLFFLSNLHPGTVEEEVSAHFSKFGELVFVHMMREEGSLENKGYAIIQYAQS